MVYFGLSMIMELDSFEKMKILVQDNDKKLLGIISRSIFEKWMYWYKIPISY